VTRVECIELRTPRSFRASLLPLQYLRLSTETESVQFDDHRRLPTDQSRPDPARRLRGFLGPWRYGTARSPRKIYRANDDALDMGDYLLDRGRERQQALRSGPKPVCRVPIRVLTAGCQPLVR